MTFTACSVASDTCYTKYYEYDLNGNVTLARTMKYGEAEYPASPTVPSTFLTNYGSSIADPFYNGHYYTTIYQLDIGQTPSLSFSYRDDFLWTIINNMTTVMTYNNLDTSTAGYYYREYHAYNLSHTYDLAFRIVFEVGDPTPVPQKQITYHYDNTNWNDQLTSYDILISGITTTSNLTYDSQGNPTQITHFNYSGTLYNHANLTWFGRQLTGITVINDSSSTVASISYTYNDQGYRTSKTINGVKTSYYLQGDKVLYETNGTYGILYTYNHDGSLIGYKYISSISTPSSYQEFYYVFDSQGDITGIINSSRYLVATYTYDAYGNQTINIPSTYQSTYGTALNANPYTYKGYRYDAEINMYYLNSRYYNPEIGRFISSDGMLGEVGDVLSTNMYAYTENNPVMNYDPTGYMSDEYNAVNEDEPTLARAEDEGFTDPVEEISSDINVEPEKTVNADTEQKSTGSNTSRNFVKGTSYKTFRSIKNYLGKLAKGFSYHHIVEQCQAYKSGFSKTDINSEGNIIAIDDITHAKISAYYSSITAVSEGIRVRDWLEGKSFEEQYQFGIDVLSKFGVDIGE